MTQSTRCPCCALQECGPCLEGLVRCRACGHVRVSDNYSEAELKQLYSENYFKGDGYPDYECEENALRANFRRRVRDLAPLYAKGSRLFEIGCAYGYFLDEAQTHFSVVGCDICESAVKKARERFGVDAQSLDFVNSPMEANQFDVVCMWDTIEHLGAPEEFVRKAAHMLKSGGTLALSTGDIGSLNARIRGKNWRLISPPHHIHYFCASSVRALLERNGFHPPKVRYDAFWRSLGSSCRLALGNPRTGMLKTVYDLLTKSGLLNVSFPLNLFDLMTVYAVKR